MKEFKTCKQCGRELPLERFRKYAARGRGVYETKQGHYTICKDCESISNRAAGALRSGDELLLCRLTEHYQRLLENGYPPVTAPAKKLLGYEEQPEVKKHCKLEDLLEAVAPSVETIERHCRLVRERGYESFQEADKVHRQMATALKQRGLYEEINDLMDDWYMEA